jgi:hypothetical protein
MRVSIDSADRVVAKLVDGPHGPSIAATGTPLTDESIRSTLEAVRERRRQLVWPPAESALARTTTD